MKSKITLTFEEFEEMTKKESSAIFLCVSLRLQIIAVLVNKKLHTV